MPLQGSEFLAESAAQGLVQTGGAFQHQLDALLIERPLHQTQPWCAGQGGAKGLPEALPEAPLALQLPPGAAGQLEFAFGAAGLETVAGQTQPLGDIGPVELGQSPLLDLLQAQVQDRQHRGRGHAQHQRTRQAQRGPTATLALARPEIQGRDTCGGPGPEGIAGGLGPGFEQRGQGGRQTGFEGVRPGQPDLVALDAGLESQAFAQAQADPALGGGLGQQLEVDPAGRHRPAAGGAVLTPGLQQRPIQGQQAQPTRGAPQTDQVLVAGVRQQLVFQQQAPLVRTQPLGRGDIEQAAVFAMQQQGHRLGGRGQRCRGLQLAILKARGHQRIVRARRTGSPRTQEQPHGAVGGAEVAAQQGQQAPEREGGEHGVNLSEAGRRCRHSRHPAG